MMTHGSRREEPVKTHSAARTFSPPLHQPRVALHQAAG